MSEREHSGHFPGLAALLAATPKSGTIGGYIKNACSYKWSEEEKRWVDNPDAIQTHYLKYPGEDWKEVK
jgi:hypothetical protein